ncbi:hypothetical protein Tco_0435749 [Tanacetum coccineum]
MMQTMNNWQMKLDNFPKRFKRVTKESLKEASMISENDLIFMQNYHKTQPSSSSSLPSIHSKPKNEAKQLQLVVRVGGQYLFRNFVLRPSQVVIEQVGSFLSQWLSDPVKDGHSILEDLVLESSPNDRNSCSDDQYAVSNGSGYAMKENKGRMPTKIELTLEQSQQGVSNDVLVSIEGVEE